MNMQRSATIRYSSEAAPALTILLLLILPLIRPNFAAVGPEVIERQAVIRDAMEKVPYSIGMWVGSDTPVQEPATELLHPNAILSREYRKLPDGAWAHVMIVHCSDIRDMVGHYPPVCYPSSGWTVAPSRSASGRSVTIEAGRTTIAVQAYEFTRASDIGSQVGIRIFDFFILPGGTISRQMDDIYQQSERLALSVQGAAQVQIITSMELSEEQAKSAASALLTGMGDILRELEVEGVTSDG